MIAAAHFSIFMMSPCLVELLAQLSGLRFSWEKSLHNGIVITKDSRIQGVKGPSERHLLNCKQPQMSGNNTLPHRTR